MVQCPQTERQSDGRNDLHWVSEAAVAPGAVGSTPLSDGTDPGVACVVPVHFARQPETLHWWEREPLRIVDVVTSFDQLMQRTPADWATGKAAQLYNAEHFEVMNLIKGLDDQGFFFSSKAAC